MSTVTSVLKMTSQRRDRGYDMSDVLANLSCGKMLVCHKTNVKIRFSNSIILPVIARNADMTSAPVESAHVSRPCWVKKRIDSSDMCLFFVTGCWTPRKDNPGIVGASPCDLATHIRGWEFGCHVHQERRHNVVIVFARNTMILLCKCTYE